MKGAASESKFHIIVISKSKGGWQEMGSLILLMAYGKAGMFNDPSVITSAVCNYFAHATFQRNSVCSYMYFYIQPHNLF